MSDVSFSVATGEDVEALRALRIVVAEDMTAKFGLGGWSDIPSEALVRRQMRASRVLVARRDDRIVGTVRLATAQPALLPFNSFTPVSQAVYVFGLAVAPHTRKRGVGRTLMDMAKAALPDWPADALWLDAYDPPVGAGAFYERCGFRRAGRIDLGGVPLLFYEWLARQ